MALSEFVTVNIQAGTATPSRQGFGTPLIISNGSQFPTTEVRTYRTFTGVANDFDSNHFPYQAAQAAFAQTPRVEQVKVKLLPTPSTAQTMDIDITSMVSGTNITGSLTSPAGSGSVVLATWDTDHATTAVNLSDAIGAFTGISASAASNTVTTTAGTAGDMWHFSTDVDGISILDTTADWDYDDELDNALAIDEGFYFVIADNNSAKNIDKIARWASSNNKLAVFSPQVTKPADWGASLFSSAGDHSSLLGNDNAVMLFTEDERTNAKEAAWVGKLGPQDPGSATWALQTLNSVGADSWTSTERSTINDHDDSNPVVGGNVYFTQNSLDITNPGKTVGGEWIDVVRTIDWLEARIKERIFGLLVNSPKVPYTDKGGNMIKGEVLAQLRQAVRRGAIEEGFTVTVLPVAQQSTTDRNSRILREVEFQATLQGAIQKVIITGTVTA